MKFAKQLALRSIPTWAIYYIDYRLLKKAIKEFEIRFRAEGSSESSRDAIVEEFRLLFIPELDKVNDRYKEQEEKGTKKLEALKSEWNEKLGDAEKEKWRRDFSKLMQALEYLCDFTHTNIIGFQKNP
ncbi:hypothetical protein DSO57_1004758 [Entomophthora muscae]|uniref:Uncharacterized protein n=1 Tax=Entomophthora muscae TaxID=34485 RepID=A0ACC2UHY4_9FUNG|nr:hypothetical protein DSO57_1004758 [Entomophthora muscae]